MKQIYLSLTLSDDILEMLDLSEGGVQQVGGAMKIDLQEHILIVERETNDITYPNTSGGESRFLYHIKKELNKQGYDMIKKLMRKDGHLVDVRQQYIRSRKVTHGIYIFDPQWSIRFTTTPFNEDEKLELMVVRDIDQP